MARNSDDNSAADHDSAHICSLLEMAIRGDANAFEELVFLHREAVWRVAFRSTRDADSAMDIVQDVFIRAWRALAAFSGQSKFSTWLHRVTVNVCVDHARRRQRQDAIVDHDTSDRAIGFTSREESTPTPSQMAIQAEFARRIEAALLQLSDRQREAFMLRYFADLPLSEIAVSMNCTEGSVKRHLFRAVERLRDILG